MDCKLEIDIEGHGIYQVEWKWNGIPRMMGWMDGLS